jgi:hypothetical protein
MNDEIVEEIKRKLKNKRQGEHNTVQMALPSQARLEPLLASFCSFLSCFCGKGGE